MIFKFFMYLFLAVLSLIAAWAFFLTAVSGGYSLAAGCGLFIAVAFLVAENKL